jgi:hypothetical protein
VNTAPAAPLSHRDRAVLRAVAAGRCGVCSATDRTLIVDGRFLCDQFTGPRLAAAGLIDAGPAEGPVRLTASGAALLAAV